MKHRGTLQITTYSNYFPAWLDLDDTQRTQASDTRRKDTRTAKTIKITHKRAETLVNKPANNYLCEVLNIVAWNNVFLTLNLLIFRLL